MKTMDYRSVACEGNSLGELLSGPAGTQAILDEMSAGGWELFHTEQFMLVMNPAGVPSPHFYCSMTFQRPVSQPAFTR